MPELVRPTVDVRESFLAALDEFRAEDPLGDPDRTGLGHETRAMTPSTDERVFRAYVETLRQRALEESPRPEGRVPDTVLWYVDGTGWLGRLDIRHRLTAQLIEVGGHIGYFVRPSARRRGHATQMLRDSLPIAAQLGITPALITCRVDNVASRKVIEANGGVLEDERNGTYRFWVPTQP